MQEGGWKNSGFRWGGAELRSQLQAVGKLIPGEQVEELQPVAACTVVWLLAGRLLYIRNSFIPHPVKSTTGLVEGLEDLPC